MIVCDFCGKSEKDVKKLIIGRLYNGVAICDSCVLESLHVLIDELPDNKSEEDKESNNITTLEISTTSTICNKCNGVMSDTVISRERRKDGITKVYHKCNSCGNEKIEYYKNY